MGTASHSTVPLTSKGLIKIDSPAKHLFVKPVKKIHEGQDVQSFLKSQAYCDICTFILQLNKAMCPRKSPNSKSRLWQLDAYTEFPEPVKKLQKLLQWCNDLIDQVPPDTGPRRFGNINFRKWYETLESQVRCLLQDYLPEAVLKYGTATDNEVSALEELTPYFLGSFGSSQRLDYGTGHELSFLAFLGGIWKLGGFSQASHQDENLARNIVIGIIEPYWKVVRRLILTYTLEPAGSHGVWGLDDHFFLPYIFGSSQYSPEINENDAIPVEGSHPEAPNPEDISTKSVVDREKGKNIFFSAIGFIFDVKTGPFWEHSPMLFDISGVRSGWGKINKGMIKMYDAEVLSKFPVVQHFPFGSLFSWEQDPQAKTAKTITPLLTHSMNKFNNPSARPLPEIGASHSSRQNLRAGHVTTAPWANSKVSAKNNVIDPVLSKTKQDNNKSADKIYSRELDL